MWNLANPTQFLSIADRIIPWLAGLTFLLLGIGLYLAFFVAPPDYQQGETVKIMFVHVPAAWLAMFGYTLIAVASIGSLDLAPSPRRRRRQDRGADRRHLHLSSPSSPARCGASRCGAPIGSGMRG